MVEEAALFASCWTEVTGQDVSPRMLLSLRVIQRVHGPATSRVLRARFAATGSTTNLLREMLVPEPDDDQHVGPHRLVDPALDEAMAFASAETDDAAFSEDWGAGEQWGTGHTSDPGTLGDGAESLAGRVQEVDGGAGSLLPGLLYGASDRPPFDPDSGRRWDDRACNLDRDAILAEHAGRIVNRAHGAPT
jgi:hypothetical protein